MRNRILALFLLITMMFSVSGQLFVFAKDEGGTAPTINSGANEVSTDKATPTNFESANTSGVIGNADTNWSAYAGSPSMTFADNGYTSVSNLSAWGARAYYGYWVKFDGLEISLRASTNTGDCVGIIFANNSGAYLGDASSFAVTYWNNLYPGQARLHFGTNHDYNSASLVHVSPDTSSDKGFGLASNMVCNQADTIGWTIKFDSYNDEFYSVKITMTDSSMWENNANYNADDKSCMVYLPKSALSGLLNEDGNCYVIAVGFPSGANPACTAEYKINDTLYKNYLAGESVQDAFAKVEAYRTAAASITDADSYDVAMSARDAATEAVAKELRARELAELNAAILTIDAQLSANGDIVNIVKKAVTDKIDAAANAYKALIDDPKTNLNSDSLEAALALEKAASAEYEKRASMLSSEVKAEVETAIASLTYQNKLCVALLWVTDYQKMIEALDASNTSIVNDLVDVKAYRAGYESTKAYTNITTLLNETDKASLETAISVCDATVVNIETVVLPQLKESYIKAMEDKIAADLTLKPNLDDAKSAYSDIESYVTITEADGELYNRFVAGYNTIKNACEAYVRAQIKSVSDLLDVKYTVLDDFKSVRNSFKAINLEYLMEKNEDIENELADLDVNISANIFYYMNSTNIPLVEWNSKGLAVESKVEFPSRLNYNKMLDLRDGVEVVIELTSAAYYNDGTCANNLCFNFLASPDSYKSMSDGISIVVWLFATESNVQIMNNTDTPIASSAISTPLDGGTITISIKYEEYYSFVEDTSYMAYVIKVNESEIVLTKDSLTNNGHSLPDEVYFSMGSFADDKSYPNILTLVSVNEVDFGMPSDDNNDKECTDHVDADGDGKCDNCGVNVEQNQPNDPVTPNEPNDDDDQSLSLVQKLARFLRSIIDAIKNFFTGLIGKISG